MDMPKALRGKGCPGRAVLVLHALPQEAELVLTTIGERVPLTGQQEVRRHRVAVVDRRQQVWPRVLQVPVYVPAQLGRQEDGDGFSVIFCRLVMIQLQAVRPL